MRVGIGLDYHRFGKGRKLIIGGVEIPYERGLIGHSDADVLTHAICDALLGAAGLGDLGLHFPPEDPRYEGISSLKLLGRVREMLAEKGHRIENVDAVVVAEEPKLAPHFKRMKKALAQTLKISLERINIKATLPEGLGALGHGEGMMAQAVALLSRR